MDRKLLGKRIREERTRIGLTQEQMAERINVSTTYIGFVERGERSVTLEKLIQLAECFHVPIDTLLHEIPDDGPEAKENQLQTLWNRASNDDKDLILSIAEVIVAKSQNN